MSEAPATPPAEKNISVHVSITWIHILIGCSAGLTIFTLFNIPKKEPLDDYTLLFIAWGVSILILLFALYWLDRSRPTQPSSLTRQDWLLFGWLVLMAFLLRFWRISSIPFSMSGDESSQAMDSLRVLQGLIRNPFTTGWYTVPTMNFFFNSLFMAVIPDKFVGLRLPYTLFGSFTVGGVYLLVRQITGRRLATLTALLTLTYHYHIHYSRVGSNQVVDPFFMVFALYFLYCAMQENRLFFWGLSGVFTGLAMYAYAGARLTLLVISGILVFLAARTLGKFIRQHWHGAVIFYLGFLITGAQMLQFAALHPDDFNARVNQIGIIQSGWLAQEAQTYQVSQASVLWEQFYRSFFALTYYQDRTVWYKPDAPMLDPASSVLFIFGLLYGTIALFKNQKFLPFAAWWWGGTLLGSMLTESPPSSQRLVTLIVPSLFFVAFAVDRLIQMLRRAIPQLRGNLLYYIFLLIFAFNSLFFYFVEYTPRRAFGGGPAESATILAPYINNTDGKYPVYLLPDPDTNTEFPTWAYLFEKPYTLLKDPLASPLQVEDLNNSKGALFIAFPSRFAELEMLREQAPGGQLILIESQSIWKSEFMLYQIPPAQNP